MIQPLNYTDLLSELSRHATSHELAKLQQWAEQLPAQIALGLNEKRYGDLPRWREALEALPELNTSEQQLNRSAVMVSGHCNDTEHQALEQALRGLHPWRKGPFELFGVQIDTEWRSDWKWNRLIDHISPLQGRRVLDVGCGSGYHCWRMRGAGAELVVGIDPTPLFICQYFALQKYLQDPAVMVLPLGIEQLPEKIAAFDSVFSMGILYHRRSPIDHLIELREALCSGGELILETLVIDGDENAVLVPPARYSRMGNVWYIPSPAALQVWLEKVGFEQVQLVDVTSTSIEEQRRSDWMQFHSLEQFLDPEDHSKTLEGHPAPKRAIFTAKRKT